MAYQAIYLHIPFCLQRCNYCDFLSAALTQQDGRQQYLDALCLEIGRRAVTEASNIEEIRSIYLGGGTPSLLTAAQMQQLFQAIQAAFNVAQAAEITVEANPATVDAAYLRGLRQLGVNRLSLGCQSFRDAELAAMGRRHSAEQAREAVAAAQHSGFTNISVDLIYGLPQQTLADWQYNLQQAVALNVQHISLYGLQLDNDSLWGRLAAQGQLNGADEDLSADMLELACRFLSEQGFEHYEIANFARRGYQSRHNCAYWQRVDYLGLGLGAAGCLADVRRENTADLAAYLAAAAAGEEPPADYEVLDFPTVLAEAVFLALRMQSGVDVAALSARYAVDLQAYYRDTWAELVQQGLLEYAGGCYRLTHRGVFLGNLVFAAFLP